jgi:hypothetical protein
MLNMLLTRGMALALLGLSAFALVMWTDNQGKAREITRLEGQVVTANADKEAFEELARQRPQVEIRYRDGLAAVAAAGERTSDACLADPRIRAAYAAIGLRNDALGDAAGGAE